MSECEICGEESEKVYRCKSCDVVFCEYCGSDEDKLCLDCLEDDDDWEDNEEEDEDW
ncbi:MAG: hypothetical protein PVJ38_02880 [Candidatus Bathyarchaeota archaeon]